MNEAPILGNCGGAGELFDDSYAQCGSGAEQVRFCKLNGWIIVMGLCSAHASLWDADLPTPVLDLTNIKAPVR